MIAKSVAEISHCMTPEIIESFVQHETDQGASKNMVMRYKGTMKVIYEYLPEDKCITRERLLEWRKSMEDNNYASITILNYVKWINRYLDFVGCSEIRFNKGRAKDITGMTFGYLKAIEPTGEKNRGDIVWLFECKCGRKVKLPATRVLLGNTLSCGCLKGAHFKTTNKYFEGTSLVHSMKERVESKHAVSGYVGVTPKRDKWQAYIRYKGVHYSLGCYSKLEDAVKARARAKELVIADAQGLLDFYSELEKTFPKLPNKHSEPKREFPGTEWIVNDAPTSAATRSDNQSGYTGVSPKKGKWEARICYQGVRYLLGSYDRIEKAVDVRRNAEALLKDDPEQFVKKYERYPHHRI